ncbi:MAG: DUF2155 domain-containing protein [Geminicoccaceae bacterium]
MRLAAPVGLGLLLAIVGPLRAARADGPVLANLVAELQALDKITARTTQLRLPLGTEVAFGTLRITARACLKTPPTEPPESAAFLEIKVADPGTATKTAFTGWMFASSPSLSALEHPVYDVWLLDCAEPVEPEPAPPPPAAPLPPSQG